jgi:hypothetical protein
MVVIGAGGRMLRDDEAVSRVVGEARRDPNLAALVCEIEDVPAGFGYFGMLLRAKLCADGGDVVVKVNAQPTERTWLSAVDAATPGVVPTVYGDGDATGDLELGWLCMERLPHLPPEYGSAEWYQPLIEAVARWHDATRQRDIGPLEVVDAAWIAFWVDCAIDLQPSPGLRRLRDRVEDDWAWLTDHFELERCHGDVHFSNAGARTPDTTAPLVLFDPMPRLAPWPFDAAYCHTLTGYKPVQPGEPSLVERLAAIRRAHGSSTQGRSETDRASRLMCAWLVAMWRTLFNDSQPDRADTIWPFVDAALDLP